ncbi:serine protease [Streptomyces sp. SA15]|uniref:serine protease n=1 Tax=Streptomyces sp. SA15 TaxID=934019 RepID=UPI00211C8D04|nr:serine protease [Streptomyces sp. SA15]
MAGRGPRKDASGTARPDQQARHARGRRRPHEARGEGPGPDAGLELGQAQGLGRDEALVRIHDPAGRPRGTGFVADHLGTVVTSHETVDGLPRLVLHAVGDRSCVVAADAVTPLPELSLALIHTEGLDVDPLPITVRDRIEIGTYVRVPAGCWREARVLGTAGVTYTATHRVHHLDDALELAIGTAGRDALRLGGGVAGGPVLDATSGAVVGVLGTALRNDHGDAAFAVALRPPPNGPLAELLARNATTVPAYGADLNLAGVLELTAISVGREGPPGVSACIGPVIEALLYLARRQGTHRLAHRLEELTHAFDADPHSWWAARLLAEVLLRVPDATPYTAVLLLLTDRIVTWRGEQRHVPAEFGPDFWTALPLPQDTRVDLLRRLVLADGPPQDTTPRYLDAAARLLAADPTAVQPHLTRWFDDERPLPATPHATVAEAAQALLHTHRHRALDDLTEVLVDSAHRRADELLAVLAEDEPSAVCRAVDRWAHDARPARRVAAVAYGLRTAPHVRTEGDRELLRHAALALLACPADRTLHGGALALLVRDPRTPDDWAAVVGPSARRMIENLAGVGIPA